jgi:hypothetical protein
MTVNVVSVVVAADSSPADAAPAEGHVVAIPTGVQWPDTSNNPIVPMVVQGTLANGTVTLQLVASDNFAPGVLTWTFNINIRGLKTVTASDVPVNFSLGATQNVWPILAAAGWNP